MKKKHEQPGSQDYKFRHTKLEPRRLLNADFTLSGTTLTLDQFENSDAGAELLTVNQTGTTYEFVLSDGVWDSPDDGIATAVGNTLSVDNSLNGLLTIMMESDTATQFDINFTDFDFNGAIDITSTGGTMFGDVTQTGGTSFIHSGALGIDVAGAVALSQVTNDLDSVTASGGDVDLTDINSISLGNVDATTLDVIALNAGEITQDASGITVSGAASFTATGNDITLNTAANDFQSAVSVDGANVDLTDIDSFLLGNVDATTLDVIALNAGEITQDASGVTVSGAASFTATGNDITLNTAANDFQAAVSADGANVDLTDMDSIELGDIDATTLDVVALGAGEITQDATGITVTGAASFTAAGNDITLDTAANDFQDVVNAIGANITLTDANNIDLGAITGTTLSVTSTDVDVTGLVSVTGLASFTSTSGGTMNLGTAVGGEYSLDDAELDGITAGSFRFTSGNQLVLVNALTQTTSVEIVAGTGAVAFNTTSSSFGDLTVTSSDTIGQDVGITVAGTTNLTATNDITLDNAANDFQSVVNANGANVDLTDVDSIELGDIDATTLDVIALNAGEITQDATGITVTGAASFTATGNDITLNTTANDFQAAVSADGANVDLTDMDSIELGDIDATTLDVVALGAGEITQDATGITVTGAASFTAAGNDITLDTAANDFQDVVNAIGANITLTDANNIDLGAITGTTLSVTSTDVDVTGLVSVTGLASFTSTSGGTMNLGTAVGGEYSLTDAELAGITAGNFQFTSGNQAVLVNGLTQTTPVEIIAGTGAVNFNTVASSFSTLTVTSSDSIGQDVEISVSGATDLTATNDITLNDADNDFMSAVSTAGVNVTLVDINGIDLGTTTATGNLDVMAGDAVTDSGTQTITGTTNIVATGFDITLDEGTNDFMSAVSTAGENVTLVDTNGIDLGTTTATGNLDVTAGGAVTDSGTQTITGTTTVTATGFDITLDDGANDFMSAVSATGAAITLVDVNLIELGTITGSSLNVTSTDVTVTGVVTVGGGLASFTSTSGGTMNLGTAVGGEYSLTDAELAGITAGNFQFTSGNQTVLVNGLTQTTPVEIIAGTGAVNFNTVASSFSTLTVTSSDSIGQDVEISVSGATDLTATNDITLNDADNDFMSAVSTAGVNVTLVDINGIDLGTTTATGNLDVMAGDAVTDSGTQTITGTTNIVATGFDITLDEGTNDFMSAVSTAGVNVTLVDINGIDLGTTTATGNLDVTAGGAVTDSGTQTITGTTTVTATGFDITLDEGTNDFMSTVSTFGANITLVDMNAIDLGITTASESLAVTSSGDITQSGVITVALTSNFMAGAGDICLTDPANDFVGEVTGVGAVVEFVDRNALMVGNISAVDNIYLRSGATDFGGLTLNGNLMTTSLTGQVLLQSDDGAMQAGGTAITTSELLVGGDMVDERTGSFSLLGANAVGAIATNIIGELHFATVAAPFVFASNMLTYSSTCGTMDTITGINATGKIRISANGITISDAITSTTVFLESTNGVMQDLGGSITATNLMLSGMGVFDLTNSSNNTVNLAAAITGPTGTLNYVDANDVNVRVLTCDGVVLTGVSTSMELTIDTSGGNGNITQDAGASVIVGTTTLLTAGTGDICLTDTTNDFMGLVTASAMTVEIVDSNDLLVGDITAVNDIFLRSGDSGVPATLNEGTLTLTGTVVTGVMGDSGQVLLQSDDGVAQTGGMIQTSELLLGGDIADEGTGNFVLTSATNEVAFLAADLEDNLSFTDSTSLVIADLTYASDCLTTEAICGLNIGGDLVLDITGSLTQTASVIVQGTTSLTATVDICLTGGDCTGDGLNDNDFVGVVTASAMTVEIVDSNDLLVGDITAVNDIFLRSGDSGVPATLNEGLLTLTGTVVTGVMGDSGQVLLQSDDGVAQTGGMIQTSELLLGGDIADEGTGNFVLTSATNEVAFLSADLEDNLSFTDSTSLVIADLTYASDCLTTEAICGLNIGGDLVLDITGSLTQTASVIVQGTTSLTATVDICLTGGDCTGDGLNDNDFVGVVTASAMTVEIVDSNDLLVGDITAVNDIFLRSGDSGVPATLNEGLLTLTGTVVTGVMGDSGQVLLQSDDGVAQTGGMIQTSELLLGGDIADEGTGNFVLTSATNEVAFLAADLEDNLSFTDSTSLVIADLTYASDCLTTEAICGLNIGGDLVLDITGSLTQTASVIVQGTTSLTATVDICLTGGDCTGDGLNDNDFVGVVTASAMTVEIVDSNDLLVGDITAVNDIFLRSGDSGVPATLNEGTLTLTGTVVTGVMGDSGQVLLQSDDGVAQTGGMIQTSELLLGGDIADEGTGNFVLTSATNEVAFLSADLEDNLSFTDSTSLVIADLTYASDCLTTEAICGLNIGGDLVLDITGSLTQTASVIVQGTTSLTATVDICLTGGDCTGDGLNDNDFVGVVTASAMTVEIVDSNDLLVGDITAVNDIFLRSGDSGVPATLNEGLLTLTGTVVTGVMGDSGQVLLQSDDGVAQTGGMIQTSELLLGGDIADEGTGNFVLTSATNEVAFLAADLEDNLSFTDSTSLVIADLTYASDCLTTEAICGLNIGGDLVLDITGSLTQTASVIVQGTTSLTATVDICLTGGDCTGDGLNDNDFVGVVTASAMTVEIVDSNDLLVGDITAVNDIFLRSGDSGVPATLNEGLLTLTGTVVTGVMGDSGQVLLQSDDGVAQTGGMIQTSELLLGGDIADEGTGNFVLTSATNEVAFLAADLEDNLSFTDSTSLVIADLTYASDCLTTEAICGLNIGGDLVLDITGSLTQTASVIVQGTTSLTATVDICLTGGDCTGDGLNDNDFVGVVTASAMTVEIVDSNDLLVGDITAVNDIFLRSGDSGVPATLNEGLLTLTGTVVTGVMGDSGQVLLQSDDGVAQTGGMILTSELLLGGNIADEGTGNFVLTSATNEVAFLAADLEDNLSFTDSTSLVIADLTYASDCLTTEAICGLNIGGDLVLDITGSLTQTASVIVQGTTSLTATVDICLTGGDCTGDGLNDNDFVGVVTASAMTVEIVDSNDLLVGDITAVNDIFLRSGDSGVPATLNEGTLTLTGTVVTGVMGDSGQVLLQSDDGVAQTGGMIQTSELLLGGDIADEGTGNFVLTSATNEVAFLAADLEDNLSFTDSTSLVIADLTYASDCLTTEAICGLNIGGDLVLDITGSLTQTASVIVQGTTGLTATVDICLTGGDCTGDGLNDNDFVGVVTASAMTVEIVDSNDLLVGDITAVNDIFLRSGDSGVPATLNEGTLTLTGTVVTGVMGDSGQVLLQSDDGVAQTGGMIQTSELLLGGNIADEGTGNFVLTSATNEVAFLAADLEDNLSFTDSTSLVIADLTYASDCLTTEAICGLNIGGDLVLDITGSLTQTASVIVQGTTSLTATVDICLTGGDCTGDGLNDNDFVGVVTASAMTVEIVDSNDLLVGDITAVNDIFLRSGDSGVPATLNEGTLTLTGTVVTGVMGDSGQVLLQSDDGVAQTGGMIQTSELLLGGDIADEGTGNFVLTSATNEVAFLAADLEDNLSFTDSTSLVIADLTYASDCLTTEAICGLNIGGDLVLDITGSLTQTASVIVQGTTSLTATVDICLTGGDCTGDGLNDNDFVGVVTASAMTVEIVDSNDLLVGDITAVNDIFLRSGDSGVPATLNEGLLTLTGTVVTGVMGDSGQVLLQSDDGVAQTGGMIQTSELLLGGNIADEGTGNFVLTSATNEVAFLAADLEDNLSFTDSTSLVIADLTYASDCLTTEAICGLNIGGDLVLDITGSLTQTASVIVQGTTSLTATVDICLTGGDCTGDGLNDNDFVGVVTASAMTVEIVDSNDLLVGDITAVNDIFLRSGDSGVPATLNEGLLTLTGTVVTGVMGDSGQVLLQSDDGVAQTGGMIQTSELLLGGNIADEGTGNFVLTSATNEVAFLAADLEDNLSFTDSTSLVIADLTYASDCLTTEAICGLNIGGDLVLDITGSLTQTASVIVQGTTSLTATVDICLTGGDCTGDGLNDNDFVGVVTASAMTVEIVDSNDLLVGDITAVNDIFLRSGDSGVPATLNEGLLTLTGTVVTGVMGDSGQVLLQSDDGVAQTGGMILTSELLLGGNIADEGTGNFVLTSATNEVAFLAADLEGNLSFTDSTSLVIADLTYASDCLTTEAICGLNIGGDLVLDITGSLTQTASVIVQGTTSLTATVDICLTGGDCTGDGLNDNDFVGVVTASAITVEIVDSNDLLVGDITAVNDIFLRSGDSGVPATLNEGLLTLTGTVVTGVMGDSGQVLLQSDDGVAQTGGMILTSELLLGGNIADEGTGNFVLTSATNEVAFLAADLEDNLSFTDSTSLVIADLTYASDCLTTEAICGLNIGGDLVLDITGSLTQTASVIVQGTTSLTATVDICLTGGDCTGDGLNDNDFVGVVTASAMTVEIVDSNDLLVGDITAVNDIFLRSGDSGVPATLNEGLLTLTGTVVTGVMGDSGQVLLQSDDGVAQTGGMIQTSELLLGGDIADEGTGNFVLTSATNEVAFLAADLEDNLSFTDSTSLVIADLTYASDCLTTEAICGLNIGGDLVLDITGSLTQTASVIVQGTTSLTATVDICLTGGDCTGDGLNDNDFVGVVTASAMTVEIVDSNDLLVGDITAVNDIFLRSGDSGVPATLNEGLLTLTGTVVTGVMGDSGQVLLQSDDGVAQTGGMILTSELLLGGNIADEGTGNFVLTSATNEVAFLAADLEDNLSFTDSTSLVIADLTYASDCLTTEAICGLNIGGDLVLDITGSLTQTASVIVQGTTSLTATVDICLTGGDCTGDGLNDNDFVGVVTASAMTVEIVDSNDLLVGDITAVNDIFLRSGDSGVPATLNEGLLTLTGTVVTGVMGDSGQVLLQSDDGVAQTGGMIQTSELLLGGDIADEGTGNFVLTSATNEVAFLAADLEDNLSFTDSTSLVIADLTYASDCLTTEAICGLNIGGDLVLDITGSLTQTASVIVQGTTSLTATVDICLLGGDCTGDTFNDNDFVGVVTASAMTVEIVDSNDLLVGDITAVNDIFLRSGDSGVPATLNEGTLTLTGTVVTGVMGDSGQVLLQSDDGVAQTGGMIQTSELLLGGDIADEGTGNFVLTSATNEVAFLAADLEDNLSFTDSTSLVIADLTYDSDCLTTEAICGLNIGGDLMLDITGGLTQTAAVIVRGATDLSATQEICLTGGDCSGDGFNDNNFVGEVTASATAVEIVDSNALVVGEINAVDNIFLRSGDTGVAASLGDGRLTINGNLTTSAANGEILLQSDDGVNQTNVSVITTNELLLGGDSADESSGDFILVQANLVDNLAADLEANLAFFNASDLVVVEQTYDSVCPTVETICGLNIGGDLQLNVTGDLTQSAAVIVQGTSELTATGIICFTGGDCDGITGNDNDFVGEVTATATTVEIVDSNDLIVGDVNAVDGIFLRSGESGLTVMGDDILGEGTLTLNGNLTTTSAMGRVLLQSDNGVNQLFTSRITTDGLLVGGAELDEGSDGLVFNTTTMMLEPVGFDLIGDNRITNVVANLEDGTLQLNNVGNLTIESTLTFTSCTTEFSETIEDLVAKGDSGELALTNPDGTPLEDPNVTLADTVQGTNVNGDPTGVDPLRYNPLFEQFLDVNDVGIAVRNAGALTTVMDAQVIATQADVYLETTDSGIISVNDTVQVVDPMNRILAIAGGDLDIGVNGRFERGAMADGLLIDELNDLLIENPSDAISTFAQVDASTLNQKLQFIYGTPGEQVHVSTIFWGIVKALDAVDDAFDLPSLTSTELAMLEALLFDGTNDLFESRSFYDVASMSVDGLPPFDGTADGDSDRVLSQPMNGIFGQATDTPTITTASFRLEFLRDNPEFLNVQFLFNDANINIFENSSTELVDLNVATADFEGLARIGEQPVLEVERIEFQIPQRVEITVTPEVEFYQSIVIDENPLFVQTVQEKFVVVVFFDSEFAADDFEAKFEALEDGEKDYDKVRQELIDDKLEALEWDSTDENTALDVNQIREILDQAGIDLEDDETSDWLEEYKKWIIKREKGEADLEPPPKLPRGVYKIIEVENGKAIIQGDDIDHRFVPEPVDEGGKRYDFDIKPPTKPDDDGASLRHQDTTTNRVARWSALLENETGEVAETMVAESPESGLENGSAYIGAASTTVGLLAMLCHRNSKQNKTIEDEIQSLGELKAKRPDRNIFSRAARFSRRNDRVNRKDS